MRQNWRRTLSRAYFDRDHLATHHLRSFDHFLSDGLQAVVDEKGAIETEVETSDDSVSLRIELGDIQVGSPQITEKDGHTHLLYPHEARLRNLTYSAPMFLGMQIVVRSGSDRDTRVLEEDTFEIGRLPIMIGSDKCNLNDCAEERSQKGEDPTDPGGYFIVNGSERVLIVHEDLVHNRILTEMDSRNGIPVAKTISQSHGQRIITTVQFGKDRLLRVSFPNTPEALDFTTVLRALGVESDEEILNYFVDHLEVLQFIMEQLEIAEVTDTDDALRTIGQTVASNPEYDEDDRLARATEILEKYLLPHLTDQQHPVDGRQKKADFLCRMAKACISLALGYQSPDDKDHYRNKRLKTAGGLMKDLFRSALNRFDRDVRYHVQRAHKRQRRIEINTVIQRDLISSRFNQALATGSWVGGRTGVSQIVKRINYLSLITQLRRIGSPLSRSRPHIEARDLHATQWGRICPSETPEGMNCGLVKHLAQGVDISHPFPDEEELRDTLITMGVNPE